MQDTPAFIEEPYMPAVNSYRYNVHFYYDLHNADAASFWKDEGKYWNREVEKFMNRRGGLGEAIRSTVAPTDTEEQKARKIYAFVQSLQNLEYSPPRTDEEMKALKLKDARGVEDVLRQKMGDAEDLARLYVAMAREAGLNAYVMRVATRDHTMFNEKYLSFDQLDHEIAIVKLESGEVTLDPGVRYCPFGVVYWKHSNTRGLRQSATAKGAEFGTVESSQYTDAWLRRNANFKLTSEGKLSGTVDVVYAGQRALVMRLEHWNTDEAGKRKALEDELKQWLPADAEVILTNRPKWESDEELVASYNVTTPAASSAGRRYLLPLDIFQFNDPPRFPYPDREWPIAFDFPYRTTDHLHLTLPEGLQVESVPAPAMEKLTYAMYSLKLASSESGIEVLRDHAMAGCAFPKDRYPELKSFYDKVKAGDDQQVVLKGRASAAGN